MDTAETALPKRKHTRLKHYDYSSTGAYFVTICTKDRCPILSTITAPKPYVSTASATPKPVGDGALDVPYTHLTSIGDIVEKYLLSSDSIPNVEIDEYVIMPDHIHAIIIIRPDASGTSRAPSPTAANELLPHIISTFKRFCNKEIGYNIFQRSYMEHVIRNNKDYEAKRKYIYENPIKRYYSDLEKAKTTE